MKQKLTNIIASILLPFVSLSGCKTTQNIDSQKAMQDYETGKQDGLMQGYVDGAKLMEEVSKGVHRRDLLQKQSVLRELSKACAIISQTYNKKGDKKKSEHYLYLAEEYKFQYFLIEGQFKRSE